MDRLLGSVVFVGGTLCGLGTEENAVACANGYADAEAYHLVFKTLQGRLTMVPHEACIAVDQEEEVRVIGKSPQPPLGRHHIRVQPHTHRPLRAADPP